MTPHRGNTILFRSSQQLPRLRLGPSKGFLSWHGALLGPSTRLVRCFRNYRDTRTLSGVSVCAEVPGHCKERTTDTNLDCEFVQNTLFSAPKICEGPDLLDGLEDHLWPEINILGNIYNIDTPFGTSDWKLLNDFSCQLSSMGASVNGCTILCVDICSFIF